MSDLFYDLLEVACSQGDIKCLIKDAIELCKIDISNIRKIIDICHMTGRQLNGYNDMINSICDIFMDRKFVKDLDIKKTENLRIINLLRYNKSIIVPYLSHNHPKFIFLLTRYDLSNMKSFIHIYDELGTLSYDQVNFIRNYKSTDEDFEPIFQDYKNPIVLTKTYLGNYNINDWFRNKSKDNYQYVINNIDFAGKDIYLNPNGYERKFFVWNTKLIKLINDNRFFNLKGDIYKINDIFKVDYETSLNLLNGILIRDLINIVREYVY